MSTTKKKDSESADDPKSTTDMKSSAANVDSAESTFEKLTQKIERLNISSTRKFSEDFRVVADWIREAKQIVVLSGAGVSCSAGIPDFRTPGTGLYDNLQKYNLPYPEAVFDVGFYERNPEPFCSLAQSIWPGLHHSPTYTHVFVALLAKHNKLLRNYTQNIDGLEALAKIPLENIMECHGHFRTASCTKCRKAFDGDKCKAIILKDEKVKESPPPICKSCGSYVKPDIVFFGEGLPRAFGPLLEQDLPKADLLLVMGTSLSVAPVSMIPDMVNCKRVLINRELVGGFNAKRKQRRDVFLGGDCDETVHALCDLLQWKDMLLEWKDATRIVNLREL